MEHSQKLGAETFLSTLQLFLECDAQFLKHPVHSNVKEYFSSLCAFLLSSVYIQISGRQFNCTPLTVCQYQSFRFLFALPFRILSAKGEILRFHKHSICCSIDNCSWVTYHSSPHCQNVIVSRDHHVITV